MRASQYVRAPIQANALANLAITEAPPVGEVTAGVPNPFSIEIAFDLPPEGPPKIAPIWEGDLWFVAAVPAALPQTSAEVRESRFPTWNTTGALVLTARDAVLTTQLRSDVPIFDTAPNLVRYDQVTLTRAFLFTTLQELLQRHTPGAIPRVVDASGEEVPIEGWFEAFLFFFLRGKASVPFVLHAGNPNDDGMDLPMPTVAATGGRATFRLSFATRSARASDPAWWTTRTYDHAGIGMTDIVDSSLRVNDLQLPFEPRHPAHSHIPAHLVLSLLPDSAWVAADAAHPIRTWARAPRADGSTWRLVQVLRPPVPGRPVTETPRRLYPLFQFSCAPSAGGAGVVSQLPEAGQTYLPLTNQSYTWWTTVRTGPAAIGWSVPALMVGRDRAVNQYLDLPTPSVSLDFASGGTSDHIWTHAHPFDSGRIGGAWRTLGNGFRSHRQASMRKWGIPDEPAHPVQNPRTIEWFIDLSAHVDWDNIYGWIAASAGRHSLAPEFLHTILFGEGLGEAIRPLVAAHTPFDAAHPVDSFAFAGLDLIVYRTGRNVHPAPSSRAEFSVNLVAQHYLDPSFADPAVVVVQAGLVQQEAGGLWVEWAKIAGWAAAIELVAAELQAREGEMRLFCHTNGIALDSEEKVRYLTYIRYLSKPEVAEAHATRLGAELSPWSGASDDNFTIAGRRYRSIFRLAVAEWIENSGVYR